MAGKIKKFFKYTGLTVAVVFVLGVSFGAHEWYGKPFYINNFFNRAFIQFMWDKPEMLTSMGMLEQIGMNSHNAEWNDGSEAADDRDFEFLDDVMATLAEYDEDDLTEDEMLSVKVLKEMLGTPEEDRKYRYHNYPVNQLFGLQNQIPRFLDTFHRVNTAEDAENYISRLSKIDTKMEQSMEGILIREQKGIIPPAFVIEKSLQIMRDFVEQPAEENVLYVSFKGKLEEAEEITDEQAEEFLAAAKTEIENVVYPAYQSYVNYFAELGAKATSDDGVWKLPDGEAYYNYALRGNTTTEMTAEEIHSIGLAEVERIQAEMLEIFGSEGYDTTLGVKALFDQLGTEERFFYPDTDEGRAQILDRKSVV